MAELKHEFLLSTDDAALRAGANPTYALIDYYAETKTFRLLALSKALIPTTRMNQEVLYLTKDFKNVVPWWANTKMTYDEDAATGTRKNFRFFRSAPDFNNVYARAMATQGAGRFQLGSGMFAGYTWYNNDWSNFLVLNQPNLRKAISQTNLLAEARLWAAGAKSYPQAGPAF